MRYKTIILIFITFVLSQPASAGLLENSKDYAEEVISWKKPSQPEISFHKAFPKPIYKKSYFGYTIMGTTIVCAGAISYFTAGIGAPAAAAGTGSIATWVGGGGAGAYMAGLSTIGGWFGGNAMLGSAILNGISIGVVGGSAAKFAALPALGKVGVLTSVTATALDGVASFENPETQNLTYRVRLMLPVDMGSKSIRDFAKDFNALENDMQAADSKRDSKAYELLSKKKIEMANIGHKWAKQALVSKHSTNSDLIVLGVFSKNVGDFDLFEKLISRVTTSKVQDTGYVDYLRAIVSVEKGDLKTAENLLRKSFKLNPYAIEAPLLLVNMQGRNFKRNEKDIVAVVKRAQKHYDADKYESGYSLVSMYYRVGTLYLLNKKYAHAKFYYELALDKTSMLQKYFGNKQMTNMIKLGIANAMYGQNNKKNADEMFLKIINESENAGEIDFFKNQYAGSLN